MEKLSEYTIAEASVQCCMPSSGEELEGWKKADALFNVEVDYFFVDDWHSRAIVKGKLGDFKRWLDYNFANDYGKIERLTINGVEVPAEELEATLEETAG